MPTNEPDDKSYRELKALLGNLLWNHARASYEHYEHDGTLANILTERAMRFWTRLERMRVNGVGEVEAMEMLARDMYPTEAEPDEDEPWPW